MSQLYHPIGIQMANCLVIRLKSRQNRTDTGGEHLHMEDKERDYILHRFKTMSYFSNCVPYEYPPHLIESDMIKAGYDNIPSEEQISDTILEVKEQAKKMVIGMLKEGKAVSDIREWCEHSLECPVPIPAVNSVNMNQLLSRYDYFNYEINRIVREEQIVMALEDRKEKGGLFDSVRLSHDFEHYGITDMSDEFTKIETMKEIELDEVVEEAEKNSNSIVMEYMLDDPDQSTVFEKASSNHDVVYGREELLQVITDLIRRERFTIISREVARMGTSEMWNLINNVEAYKLWILSRQFENKGLNGQLQDNQMLEMLKMYEQSTDSLKEGYLFQVSKLNTTELSHLIRLIQGYISWKSVFHYLPQGSLPSTNEELSRLIVNGFAHEHGMDPEIFKKFLIKN